MKRCDGTININQSLQNSIKKIGSRTSKIHNRNNYIQTTALIVLKNKNCKSLYMIHGLNKLDFYHEKRSADLLKF